MIPYRTPFIFPLIYPSLTWRIPSVEKELYLTFDDGPVIGPTEFVLDILQKSSALATFFCIGDNIRKHPEVFRKIINHGHAIGNHTFNHVNGWRTSTVEYVRNTALCQAEIEKHLPSINIQKPVLFRPPYGKITWRQIKAMRAYNIIMWDVLSMDFNRAISPEAGLRKTIQATRNGSIVVFHDSFKAERNMGYILPRFIAHFAALGFTFKPLN
jgi:peptidoglycan-N-acetylglucosamine deacetylase